MELHIPLVEPSQFDTSSEYGLYIKALAWCANQARYDHDLPAEWFVPDSVIAAWNERRSAKRLVANKKWKRAETRRGYLFAYLHWRNAPAQIRKERKRDRDRKSKAEKAGNTSKFPLDSQWELTPGLSSQKGGHVHKKTL